MFVKRKDLEQWHEALADIHAQCCGQAEWGQIRDRIHAMKARIGHKLATPDPVDVVPIQDYPFTIMGHF